MKSPTVANPALDSGRIICQKIFQSPAPSILAASTMENGIDLMKLRISIKYQGVNKEGRISAR